MSNEQPRIRAERQHWKINPIPDTLERIPLDLTLTRLEYEQVRLGFIPEVMEDKWFVFMDNDWLYFHRSWTGRFVYSIHFARDDEQYRAVEAWREPPDAETGNSLPEADAAMVLVVIYSHLFNNYELANYWFDQYWKLS
jgi:hypothetical protein